MKNAFKNLIDEAIQLELNVGELYLLFYRLFPEDSEFWWEIAIEEENHAALLKTVKQMDAIEVTVPSGLLPGNLEEIKKTNLMIRKAMRDFEDQPDRAGAFRLAYKIENSAGEIHYNAFMKHAPDSRITGVFRKLNGDDVDHAERIRFYMGQHQIPQSGK